jgi:hypothetical protein
LRRLHFGHRLLLTTTGAGLGFLGTLLLIAYDRSVGIDMEGVGIFVAAAVAGALVGAAATRRWITTIIAAILAAAAVPATFFVGVLVACASGLCD